MKMPGPCHNIGRPPKGGTTTQLLRTSYETKRSKRFVAALDGVQSDAVLIGSYSLKRGRSCGLVSEAVRNRHIRNSRASK